MANRFGYQGQVAGRIYFYKRDDICANTGCCFRALSQCVLTDNAVFIKDLDCIYGFEINQEKPNALKKESRCPSSVCPANLGII
jgi:hypothetical protein